jgi:hypothetical protein
MNMRFLLFQSFANSKYYKGGFEPKMTRREASLILGISPTASKTKIKVIAIFYVLFKFFVLVTVVCDLEVKPSQINCVRFLTWFS